MDRWMSIGVILGTSFGIFLVWWISRARRRNATENVCGTGLNRADWYRLREVLLCAELSTASLREEFSKLPIHLQNHTVGKIIQQYLDDETRTNLTDAAKLMVNGVENPWLALSKA